MKLVFRNKQLFLTLVTLFAFVACNGKEPARTVKSDGSKPLPTDMAATNSMNPTPADPMAAPTRDATPVEAAPVKDATPVATAPVETDRSKPLTDKQEEILKSVTGEKLGVTKEHYYTSNETRYDLWYPQIDNLGGAYMGVGPDQSYSLAVAANVELVILMDYDVEVLALHKMYFVLVKECETPQCVIELLERKNTNAVYEKAKAMFDEPTARFIKAIHKGSGTHILKNHRARIKQGLDKGGKFWLTDETMYKRWRTLVLAGRVRLFPGDLTKGVTMTQIAGALKQMNIPLRVLYFSNAEEFWRYPQAFRDAIIAMPFDDKSVVLRSITLGEEFKIGWLFHYTIQNAADFVAWMKVPGSFSIKGIARLKRDPIDGTKYYSRIPAPAADVKMPR
ncbi:hypothetical protein KKD52_06520 [Myxococcota bacterium]|nr:hypothetical protein [Myxococcota bacterium]MBU1413275.1 hypothetical protein [Myxococcota bacterium]MBU1509998.1 hypothetical protein [Myxococcota bacterium]